ncbi:ABC transporter ATP-binding protein [Caminibacter sp.]
MNALEVKNLTKIYKLYKKPSHRLIEIFFKKNMHKKFYANKNITFSLKKGETLGIIGLNGAGKSTLLKQIAGIISPSSGEIKKYGRITALLELGTGFNFELSGRENIYLNGMLIGMSKSEIDKKVDAIIDFSELNEFIEEPLKNYSSGMIMRLAFSIAIFSEPDILIVDEALSVGDAHFSAKSFNAIKKLKEKASSIIFVSHDLNALKILCDRVILLNKGEIVQQGEPEDVINKYNYYIAKMNDKEGIIIESNKEFGSMDVEITGINIYGKESKSSVISSGEEGIIEIGIKANKNIENKTVGILIRDKFGQDIFGTNTFYYNKPLSLKKGEKALVTFNMPFNIGIGNYTLTVAVHSDERHNNECLIWKDKAAEFEIAGIKGEMFTGICKLSPSIEIKTF